MIERPLAAGLGALLGAQVLYAALELREPSVATPVAIAAVLLCAVAAVVAVDTWWGARRASGAAVLAWLQAAIAVGLGWFVWFPAVPEQTGARLAGVGTAGRWTATVWLIAVLVLLVPRVARKVPAARILVAAVVVAAAAPIAGSGVAAVSSRWVTTAGVVSTTATAVPKLGSDEQQRLESLAVDPRHVLWTRDVDLPEDASAVLVDGQVLADTFTPGEKRFHGQGGLLALDAATGQERWRFTVEGGAALAVSPAKQAVLLLVDDTLVRLDLRTGRRLDTIALPDPTPSADRWSIVTRKDTLESGAADDVLLTGSSLLLRRDGRGDATPSVHRLDLTDGALDPVDVAPSADCDYQLADEQYFDAHATSNNPDTPRTLVRDGRGCGPPQVLRVRKGDRRAFAVPPPAEDTECTNGCSVESVVAAGPEDVALELPLHHGPDNEVVLLDRGGYVWRRIAVSGGLRAIVPATARDYFPRVLIYQGERIDAVETHGDPAPVPGALPDRFGPGRTVLDGGELIGFSYDRNGSTVVVEDIDAGIERARSPVLPCSGQRISASLGRVLVSCRRPGPGTVDLVMLG